MDSCMCQAQDSRMECGSLTPELGLGECQDVTPAAHNACSVFSPIPRIWQKVLVSMAQNPSLFLRVPALFQGCCTIHPRGHSFAWLMEQVCLNSQTRHFQGLGERAGSPASTRAKAVKVT